MAELVLLMTDQEGGSSMVYVNSWVTWRTDLRQSSIVEALQATPHKVAGIV